MKRFFNISRRSHFKIFRQQLQTNSHFSVLFVEKKFWNKPKIKWKRLKPRDGGLFRWCDIWSIFTYNTPILYHDILLGLVNMHYSNVSPNPTRSRAFRKKLKSSNICFEGKSRPIANPLSQVCIFSVWRCCLWPLCTLDLSIVTIC